MSIDAIGEWSERKIRMVREYLRAYNRIMRAEKQRSFHTTYIDAFAGPGEHQRKGSGEVVPGSPIEVLRITPGFDEYHFIDRDAAKLGHLRELVGDRDDVVFHEGNSNDILCNDILPTIRWGAYRRAFCLLDPYGLDAEWRVFQKAAEMKTVEILVNFPIMDINRNVGRRNPDQIRQSDADRMSGYWGAESWWDAVYAMNEEQPNLFCEKEKVPHGAIARAFCQRLHEVAGFKCVAPPKLMKNSTGAPMYYLIFASQNEKGAKIARDVLAAG